MSDILIPASGFLALALGVWCLRRALCGAHAAGRWGARDVVVGAIGLVCCLWSGVIAVSIFLPMIRSSGGGPTPILPGKSLR